MYAHPNLPAVIRAICCKNSLTQSQFAALAGISTATIHKILKGGEVKLTVIISIASGLGMSADEFMRMLDEAGVAVKESAEVSTIEDVNVD